jgi:hypothetical protein
MGTKIKVVNVRDSDVTIGKRGIFYTVSSYAIRKHDTLRQ